MSIVDLCKSLKLDDKTWLGQVQNQAAQALQKEQFPNAQQELWRFSSVASLQKETFGAASLQVSAKDISVAKEFLKTDSNFAQGRIVFIDGNFVQELSDLPKIKQVQLEVLDRDLLAKRAELQSFFELNSVERGGPFLYFNQVMFQNLVYVRVDKNAQPEYPLEVIFISMQPQISSPKILLVLEQNAQLNVIERNVSLNSVKSFSNGLVQIDLAANSVLNYVKLQEESDASFCVAQMQVNQKSGSQFNSWAAFSGAKFARQNLNVRLQEAGASCALNGLYYSRKTQEVDHHILVDHVAPHCSSSQLYKGILDDQSHAIFDGKVIVRAGAQKTDAAQTNRNLLLSKNARINTKPDLEIFANDVKCKHGATIGQLNEQALFYLRSRGIDEKTARQMLIEAFAQEIADSLPTTDLKEEMSNFLKRCALNH